MVTPVLSANLYPTCTGTEVFCPFDKDKEVQLISKGLLGLIPSPEKLDKLGTGKALFVKLNQAGNEISDDACVSSLISRQSTEAFINRILERPFGPNTGIDSVEDVRRLIDSVPALVYPSIKTTDSQGSYFAFYEKNIRWEIAPTHGRLFICDTNRHLFIVRNWF